MLRARANYYLRGIGKSHTVHSKSYRRIRTMTLNRILSQLPDPVHDSQSNQRSKRVPREISAMNKVNKEKIRSRKMGRKKL